MNTDVTEPLTEEELDALSSYLSSDRVPESTLSLEGVDGLMCSLLIPAVPLPMTSWLPIIWGTEDSDSFTVEPDDKPMLDLLERHWNATAATFPLYEENTDEGYWPVMFLPEDDTPDDATDTEYGRDWAVGFRIGMEFHPEFWDAVLENEELASGLTPVVLLDMGVTPDEMEKPIDFGVRQELVGALIPVIHAYWALARNSPNTTH